MGVSKNNGTPKMDGENNGQNPMNKWMIWGFSHIFGNTQIEVVRPEVDVATCAKGKENLTELLFSGITKNLRST